MDEKIVQSKAKCPKCKSKDLILQEIWKDSFIEWEQLNGEFDRNDGALEAAGGPYCVTGRCNKCDHVWRFKKTHQIGDLIKE